MKVVRGDFHEHASKHGSEEQHEAKTDVEGQDVRNDNGDLKDDDQQDNEEEQRGDQDIVHSSQKLNKNEPYFSSIHWSIFRSRVSSTNHL